MFITPSPDDASGPLSSFFPQNGPADSVADSPGFVYQHNRITFSRQQQVSLLAKRILARVLAQINFTDTELRPFYDLHIQDIIDGTKLDRKNAYGFAKSAVRELVGVCWEIEDEDLQEWTPRHLLDTTRPKPNKSGVTGGHIRLVLNPELAPYFVNLARNFTRFELLGYMELRSLYSMRLYEMLSAWRDTGWWQVSIEQLRTYVDCAPELDAKGQPKRDKAGKLVMKYPRATHFIANVVVQAQRELAKTPLAFEYEELTHSEGRGRPAVVALRFRLLHPTGKKTIPSHVLEDAKFARVIARLEDFQVARNNIAAYWDILPLERMWALVKTWAEKQASDQRIQNMAAYCNAAFVREAQKWEQQKLQQQKEATAMASQLFGEELPETPRKKRTKQKDSGEEKDSGEGNQ